MIVVTFSCWKNINYTWKQKNHQFVIKQQAIYLSENIKKRNDFLKIIVLYCLQIVPPNKPKAKLSKNDVLNIFLLYSTFKSGTSANSLKNEQKDLDNQEIETKIKSHFFNYIRVNENLR